MSPPMEKLLELVRRQQSGYLIGYLEERERYIEWLAGTHYWPDAAIELKVNMELCSIIRAELFIRRGSQ